MSALIEWEKILMHCKNTSFIYHSDFNKYMKVEEPTLEDVFDYLLNVGGGKFLSAKGNIYLHDLFEKWDPKHL